LITEGSTEASCYSAAARHLSELDANTYQSLEAMGVAIFNAESESNIPIFGEFFNELGKDTFAVYDKQSKAANRTAIEENVDYCFESKYKGFEDLIIQETDREVLLDYVQNLCDHGDWPTHIAVEDDVRDMDDDGFDKALLHYLTWQKAAGSTAEIISICDLDQMPATLKEQIAEITELNEE
jgi:putative ATP-dependent endonuclease of OLD family